MSRVLEKVVEAVSKVAPGAPIVVVEVLEDECNVAAKPSTTVEQLRDAAGAILAAADVLEKRRGQTPPPAPTEAPN